MRPGAVSLRDAWGADFGPRASRRYILLLSKACIDYLHDTRARAPCAVEEWRSSPLLALCNSHALRRASGFMALRTVPDFVEVVCVVLSTPWAPVPMWEMSELRGNLPKA